MEHKEKILEVNNLGVSFHTYAGEVKAVNGVSFSLDRGKVLGIVGESGSGKSVCINSFLVSILYKATPDEVKFILIDPKKTELGVYNGIPHLYVPVVTDPKKASIALKNIVNEMEKRYDLFET